MTDNRYMNLLLIKYSNKMKLGIGIDILHFSNDINELHLDKYIK